MKCIDCNECESVICPRCLIKRLEKSGEPLWDCIEEMADKLGYPK